MVIDCHVHPPIPISAGVDEGRSLMEQFLDVMTAEGVDGSAGSLSAPLYSDCYTHREHNDFLAAISQGFEGRFWPMCVVNPREETAADEVRRCYEMLGIKALKLHPWLQGCSCSDEYNDPVYEVCAELGIPITFHDGSPPYSSTLQCADVTRRFPEVTVVLGHAGLNDQWRQARDIACEWPNIYLTMCGPTMLAMQSIVDSVPAERIMYGSDFGWGAGGTGLIRYRLHKVEALEMDEQTRELVLSGNALRLFGGQA